MGSKSRLSVPERREVVLSLPKSIRSKLTIVAIAESQKEQH